MTVTLLYSCEVCGLEDVPCVVPARESNEIDVVQWMRESAMVAIAADHAARSPACIAGTPMSEVKVPTLGVSHIGGPTVQ